jgi:putative transposase
VVVAFIDAQKAQYGVARICRVLSEHGIAIAVSTYYAASRRAPSKRSVRDAELIEDLIRVHRANFSVYGADKMWRALHREGIAVARCTVERLMPLAGLVGVSRRASTRTTWPARLEQRPADLLQRDLRAAAPDRRWVADITYVATWVGWVHVAFVTDLFSRRIVGWRVSNSLRSDLALDALEQGIWLRRRDNRDLTGLVHHSDRGVQYLSIAYTERLAEAGLVGSVGSKGDSYDNAAAEALNALFKAEVIRRLGPWKGLDDVELAVCEWVDWFNQARLHSYCGMIPPAQFEANHYQDQQLTAATAG